MSFLCYNGEFVPVEKGVIPASNTSYRYGDGLFETMRMLDGNILLGRYHFERLFAGMVLLKFRHSFTDSMLMEKVNELCSLNHCPGSARVRLSVFRENGNLGGKPQPIYIIEAEPLEQNFQWSEQGLTIGMFESVKKTCDEFSNLKSTNRLPYVMAGLYARENNLDDCLILNTQGNIADSTIANLFILRDNKIITPSLDQGCVAGVMRRFLIEKLQAASYKLQEKTCDLKELESSDEVFLTNAVRGIQWVRSYRGSVYGNEKTKEIFDQFIQNFQSVSHQNGD